MRGLGHLIFAIFLFQNPVFAQDCTDVKFFGEFSIKQFNAKGKLETKSFNELLPKKWNDNSNLYSVFFIKSKASVKELVFKSKAKSLKLTSIKQNHYKISRKEFDQVVRGQQEVMLLAKYKNIRCEHKMKVGPRD